MKSVLLTGARGFIGRAVGRALVDAGIHVVSVSRRSNAHVPGASSRLSFDLLEPGAWRRWPEELHVDAVIHLAWETRPGYYWDAPENTDWVRASTRLVEAMSAAGTNRFVVAGTCAEYDWSAADRDLDEQASPLEPRTSYGAAKVELWRRLSKLPDVSVGWARIFQPYGPGEHRDRLIPSVIRSLLDEQPAEVGAGDRIRDFIHVRDIAEALVALVRSEVHGSVNIATGRGRRIAEVVDLMASKLGRADLVRYGARPTRPDDPDRLVARTERLNTEVGFVPRVELSEGLDETIEWWRHSLASHP